VLTQTSSAMLAAGVADAEAGRWSHVLVSELLGDQLTDRETRQALLRQAPLMATATWRSGWRAVPEEHRVRTLTILMAASRSPMHPCLSIVTTEHLGVHSVGIGRGMQGALRRLPDGSIFWIALLA
jgi:hypothetical protein